MVEKVYNERRNFVGIGKILIDTASLTWNIPQLHFLVEKNAECFESVCLEFGLVSSGSSQDNAVEHLVEQTLHYIRSVVLEGAGYDELKELALNNFMSEYWGSYRHIEFSLAEKKLDLSHEIESRIMAAIQNSYDNKVKELITIKAKEAANEAFKEYEKLSAIKPISVSYIPLKDAA
jgi:hypothetical protein